MITVQPEQLRALRHPTPKNPPPQKRFIGSPESARAARDYVRDIVNDSALGLTPDQVNDIRVVTCELATNAVRYGTEPGDSFLVAVVAEPGSVRIEVHDPTRRRPVRRRESEGRGRGRGLHVVEVLATAWGIDDRPMGKIVWAEFTW
ncbi:ATP-binding protein [Streptomyces sp. NPDC098101]|uniref:ATP-binding protein n=1 Tax=Streptomyces sp. NPDC098101 TaxID=3366096 RepID=UPI0037F823C1